MMSGVTSLQPTSLHPTDSMMSGVPSLFENAAEQAQAISPEMSSSASDIELGKSRNIVPLPTRLALRGQAAGGSGRKRSRSKAVCKGTEMVTDRMRAGLTAPPELSQRDREKYENGEVLQDMSAHKPMPMSDTRKSSTIKSGTIVFTWNQTNQKMVPYWLVPDGLADDPFFVDKVLDAMGLPSPNLILRFSRLKQPVHEWRSGWNFDFTNDGFVEESALPRPLPPGMSRATAAVQKYLALVAKDRVLDILRSVSSACNQAGAWLQISDFGPGDEPLGFYDHVAPLIGQAAQEETVVYTTYSLEDRRKYPGGEAFCNALSKNAGVEGHEFPQMRPKPFTEDVTAEMQSMGLVEKGDETGKARARATGRSGRGSLFDVAVEQFFKDRVYLPAKDLSHLLVFESKSTELAFKQQLNSRTPIGNFIMQGSVAAMKMFAAAMKDGTPVFVLNGTGGAADRIALLIQHMRWRKRLIELGGDKQDEVDAQQATDKQSLPTGGCFPWSKRESAKVEAVAEPEELKVKDLEDEDFASLTVKTLVLGLHSKLAQLQHESAAAGTAGDLVRAMNVKSFLHVLREHHQTAVAIEAKMLAYMEKEGANEAERGLLGEEFAKLKEQVLEAMHAHGRAAHAEGPGGPVQSEYERERERTRNLTVLLPASRDPPEFYNQQVRRGREGLAWESKVGMKYEEWVLLRADKRGDVRLPPEWPLLWIGADQCQLGEDDGVPAPCKQESCARCFGAQQARRKLLRSVALWGKDWLELSVKVRKEYIRQWVANNPLADEASLVSLCGCDPVAELSRVIFSNVYEPPVPDAVVVVQTLDVGLSVEEVMDKVTLAMSTDALVSEVGERRAFRERLLEAWKSVRIFKHNAAVQNRRVHVLNLLIILFTFAAVLVGTVTFQLSTILAQAEAANQEPGYPGFEGLDLDGAYAVLVPVNLALPLAAGFLLALNSKLNPRNKYTALIAAVCAIECEIYKYRAKVGEYSSQGVLLQPGGSGADGGGESKPGKSKKEPPKKKNGRTVFASRMDSIWSELGSSELKQESLLRPKGIDHLMPLDREVAVQQHPSLFEEGKVLQSGNKKLVRDTIERYTRVVEDDGIRIISAQDYLDLRVDEQCRHFQRRAPRLSRLLNLLQLLVFTATTMSTALGAFDYSQWIPVVLSLGAAIASVVAYTQLEARLQRVNTALVAMSKLHIWWQRLSVIEQRIPQNKTFLVETAEAIIQSEAGCNLMNAQIEEEEDSDEGTQQDGKNSK